MSLFQKFKSKNVKISSYRFLLQSVMYSKHLVLFIFCDYGLQLLKPFGFSLQAKMFCFEHIIVYTNEKTCWLKAAVQQELTEQADCSHGTLLKHV